MLRTRIDGSLVVIECSFCINLTALTIEQVLGKRQKVVRDMIEQLRRGAQREAETSPAWAMLRDADGRCPAADRFLEAKLTPLGEHEATHYNRNGPLGDAIQEAVAVAEIVDGWPEELRALAERLGTEAEALLKAPPAEVRPRGTLSRNEAEGLCCLAWHASHVDASMSIDLEGVKASPDVLAVACRALGPSVTSLSLKDTKLTAGGANTVALERLCGTLQDGHAPRLVALDLASNELGPANATMLVTALRVVASLTKILVGGNGLGDEGTTILCDALRESTVCKVEELDLYYNEIGPDGAKAIAALCVVAASLTSVRDLQPGPSLPPTAHAPCALLTHLSSAPADRSLKQPALWRMGRRSRL